MDISSQMEDDLIRRMSWKGQDIVKKMKKCKIKGLVGDALKRFSREHVYNDSIIYSLG